MTDEQFHKKLAMEYHHILLTKNIYEVFAMSGIGGDIDVAIPLGMQKELLKMGIDTVDYVFHYDIENKIFGKPLSKLEIIRKAAENAFNALHEESIERTRQARA